MEGSAGPALPRAVASAAESQHAIWPSWSPRGHLASLPALARCTEAEGLFPGAPHSFVVRKRKSGT